mgnify:FL=1
MLTSKLTKYQIIMACIIITNALIAIQGMFAGAYNLVLICITVMYFILGIISASTVFKAKAAIAAAAENRISKQIEDVLQSVVDETTISRSYTEKHVKQRSASKF